MGFASIQIDQPLNPSAPVGQPGRARDDLTLGDPVVARNSDNTDVVRWVWALVDIPLGSTATLSSTTSPQVTFTPDLAGSYLLRLMVDDGVAGQIDEKVAAVRDSLGHRFPATAESASAVNWPGNKKGWGKDAEQILRGFGSPQLFAGIMNENVPVAASTVVTIGGLGLPTVLAQIVDYGFIDLRTGGAVGGPPVVSGWTFTSSSGGGKTLVGLRADLDTLACVAGDLWALVIGQADVGDVLLLQVTIV